MFVWIHFSTWNQARPTSLWFHLQECHYCNPAEQLTSCHRFGYFKVFSPQRSEQSVHVRLEPNQAWVIALAVFPPTLIFFCKSYHMCSERLLCRLKWRRNLVSKFGTSPSLSVFLRLFCSVPIRLVSRTCWLTCRELRSTATSSTSAAKSKLKSRTSEESSSSQGYVPATSAPTQCINNTEVIETGFSVGIWTGEKTAAAAFFFLLANILNWMLFALIFRSLPA